MSTRKAFRGNLRFIFETGSLFLVLFIISAVLSRGEPHAVFKLAAWIAIAYLVGRYARPVFLLSFFAIAGVFESFVGIVQFVTHKSVGLHAVGESLLSPLDPMIARTFVPGGRLLRAYGTFPHPNILSAFIVLSLVSFAYFHLRAGARGRIALVFPIFISCVGLVLTFSRAGWVAGVIGVFVLIFLSRKFSPRGARNTAFVFALSAMVAATTLSSAVFPRIASVGPRDYAVTTRVAGYAGALGQIASHPFFGSGIAMRMPPDPVHNLYLIVAQEIGLFGLSAFLCIICLALLRGIRASGLESRVFFAMLCALILIGLTDHFLWTLRPGAAMLWVVIGVILFRSRS